MKYILWLLLMFPLLATNCEDDPPVAPIEQLPPATQTGEYTFGCLVNGEAFIPETTRDITSFYQQDVFLISASFRELGIAFLLEDQMIKRKTYNLLQSYERGVEFSATGCRYEYEDLLEGTLTITHFDSINYIVSGTFEFITATEGCDTIRVTDGRFDLPYIP